MFGTNTPVPGPVNVCKHVQDKYDSAVKEMDLLHANQNHTINCSKVKRLLFLLGDIAPTPAGPREANESSSFSQSNKIPFSSLKSTDRNLDDLSRTNDLDN